MAVEDLHRRMSLVANIRNVTLIAHANHGKSTLIDSLVAAADIVSEGNLKRKETNVDRSQCDVTTKSTAMTLGFDRNEEFFKDFTGVRMGNSYLLNLMDTPGHIDFSAEVTASLRITDGAVLVLDCFEGVSLQTETVLRQAIVEGVRPVLTVNKLDRFFYLNFDGESAYQRIRKVVENVNVILSKYQDQHQVDLEVSPENGTVSFCSALYNWGFTIPQFAKMYASKFKEIDESEMKKRLWGEHYYDPKTERWTDKDSGSPTCKRGFVQFCYEPIKQMINACTSDDKGELWRMLGKLGLTLDSDEMGLNKKALTKCVMKKWLPASNALLKMVIYHLPSPAVAQRYRAENLYAGPNDDAYANAIRNCDPNGPLMVYISKMISGPDKGKFFAIGRVFAGSMAGGKVRIMGPDFVMEQKKDLYIANVQGPFMLAGKDLKLVDNVPSGNILAIAGLEKFIARNATVTNEDSENAHPIQPMVFPVSAVVRVGVNCKNPSDLPKLVEGLKYLAKLDSILQWSFDPMGGEYVLAGASDLHIEACVKELDQFMGGPGVFTSPPIISFRETVTTKSVDIVTSRTLNKLNYLSMEAEPMDSRLADAFDKGLVPTDVFDRSRMLVDDYDWDARLSKKILCLSPANIGPNMIIDGSKKDQTIHQIKDLLLDGFLTVCEDGGLCGEKLRGVCFKICNAEVRDDASQIGVAARKGFLASQFSAEPRLMQPVYLIEVIVDKNAVGGFFEVLRGRKGTVVDEQMTEGLPAYTVRAHLSAMEYFGFCGDLYKKTSGQALFYSCVFDHWEVIHSDPMELGSEASLLVSEIRKRKGLKE